MCKPKMPKMPAPPPERQAQLEPDGGMVMAQARRNITDRLRAMTPTILTGPMGANGTSGTKTSVPLLGQTTQVA